MFKLADLAEQDKELLATIETWDNGKPYGDSLGDVGEVIDCLRYYAGWADKIYGQTISTTAQKFAYTLKQPIGVCAQIIPVSSCSSPLFLTSATHIVAGSLTGVSFSS